MTTWYKDRQTGDYSNMDKVHIVIVQVQVMATYYNTELYQEILQYVRQLNGYEIHTHGYVYLHVPLLFTAT